MATLITIKLLCGRKGTIVLRNLFAVISIRLKGEPRDVLQSLDGNRRVALHGSKYFPVTFLVTFLVTLLHLVNGKIKDLHTGGRGALSGRCGR